MIKLKINSFKDKHPENKSIIYLIKPDDIKDEFPILCGTIEYCWFEYDERNNFTGNQITFTESEGFTRLTEYLF